MPKFLELRYHLRKYDLEKIKKRVCPVIWLLECPPFEF